MHPRTVILQFIDNNCATYKPTNKFALFVFNEKLKNSKLSSATVPSGYM